MCDCWCEKRDIKYYYTKRKSKKNLGKKKNYIFVRDCCEAVFVRILLDFFINNPTFISSHLKIGETFDIL